MVGHHHVTICLSLGSKYVSNLSFRSHFKSNGYEAKWQADNRQTCRQWYLYLPPFWRSVTPKWWLVMQPGTIAIRYKCDSWRIRTEAAKFDSLTTADLGWPFKVMVLKERPCMIAYQYASINHTLNLSSCWYPVSQTAQNWYNGKFQMPTICLQV